MLNLMTQVLVLIGLVTGTYQADSNLPAVETDQLSTKQLAQSNNSFAIDLYHQLAKENVGDNLFFSPYSVSSALAMTAEGARGETAEQMGRVLRFPKEAHRIGDDKQSIPWHMPMIHKGMSGLNKRIANKKSPAEVKEIRSRIESLRNQLAVTRKRTKELYDEKNWQARRASALSEQNLASQLNSELLKVDRYEIQIANALWGERTYPFKDEFFKTIAEYYGTGGVFPVDFKQNFESVRLRINRWVEQQTNDLIKDLIPQGKLSGSTRLVLVNAIYFKGDWSVPFETYHTKDLDYTLSDGRKVKQAIMHAPALKVGSYAAFNADGSAFNTPKRITPGQKTKLYPDKGGFSMLELPYKGNELSMVVIAPNDPLKLAVIEQKMTQENLTSWVANLNQRTVDVYMPKFKVETEYTLGDSESPATLQKMGMVRAFVDPRDPTNGAVFDGMSHATNPSNKLYISSVLHKAFVEVNEQGTEAAAATSVQMAVPVSATLSTTVPFTPTFKADRPFIYLIRDRVTGNILFLGRMMEPATFKKPVQNLR